MDDNLESPRKERKYKDSKLRLLSKRLSPWFMHSHHIICFKHKSNSAEKIHLSLQCKINRASIYNLCYHGMDFAN